MANRFRNNAEKEELQELEELVEMEKPAPVTKPAKPAKPVKKGVLAKGLARIFGGSFLSDERATQHLPFIVFLALIAILYIANGYYADDKIREENRVKNEIKELRTEYISSKSDLMFISKQSQVAAAVDTLGLKEPVVAPMKIEMDSIKPDTKEQQ